MITSLRWVVLAILVVLLGAGLPRPGVAAGGKVGPGCTLKGHKLYGKVRIVTAFPDLKVQVVDAFPDKCGLWKMVDAFPDLKIQYVNAFPGLP